MEPVKRRGKEPPVDMFTGEDAEVKFEDWLPSLQRAAHWNGWSADEQLIQLAGHLCSCAWQEWILLEEEEKATLNMRSSFLTKDDTDSVSSCIVC